MERLPTWGPRDDAGWDVEEYYGLLERGVLTERDHVELLEGVIVAGEPQNPTGGRSHDLRPPEPPACAAIARSPASARTRCSSRPAPAPPRAEEIGA